MHISRLFILVNSRLNVHFTYLPSKISLRQCLCRWVTGLQLLGERERERGRQHSKRLQAVLSQRSCWISLVASCSPEREEVTVSDQHLLVNKRLRLWLGSLNHILVLHQYQILISVFSSNLNKLIEQT